MSLDRTVENVYLRQDAAALVRKHLWPLLGMLLLSQLLTSSLEHLLTALGDALTAADTRAVLDAISRYAQSGGISSATPLLESLTALLTSPVFWLFNLAYTLITMLLSQALLLGCTAEYIRTAAGLTPQVLGIFSRARYCLKGLGLNLLTNIKILLWMLPGLVLIFADAMIMEGASNAFTFILGFGLMLGLGIPAILRYEMALPILADHPERGIRECINLSKDMMTGRKAQYCKLLALPFAVMCIVTGVINAVVGSLLSVTVMSPAAITAVTSVVTFLAGLYWVLQLRLLPALFYLKRLVPAPDAPVSYWLREHTATDIEGPSPEEALENMSPENTKEKEIPDEQSDC